MFNNLSVVELIEAISDLSGVTLQIHKDFKPIFVTPDYARLYGFDSTEQFLKLGSIMDLIPDDKKDLAIKRYQEILLRATINEIVSSTWPDNISPLAGKDDVISSSALDKTVMNPNRLLVT